ncbi:MAG: PaaI family thioesterase [Acidimicrobiales bacterium]|nr:PaaI family thioesterase [Acidimicrobiales bacterium]
MGESYEETAAAAREVVIPLHELLELDWDTPDEGSPRAEVRMPVQPNAFGFTANLHGGAIATMVDVACAMAAARFSGFDPFKESLVTADMHVRYLGRAKTEMVVARAEVVRKGRQLIVVECKVADTDDNLVATADFSMMIVPLRGPLNPAGTAPVEHGAPEL